MEPVWFKISDGIMFLADTHNLCFLKCSLKRIDHTPVFVCKVVDNNIVTHSLIKLFDFTKTQSS